MCFCAHRLHYPPIINLRVNYPGSGIWYTIADPPPSDPIFILTDGPVIFNLLYQTHALVNSMTAVTRIMYNSMLQGFGHLSLAFALRYRPAKLNTAGNTKNTNIMKRNPLCVLFERKKHRSLRGS